MRHVADLRVPLLLVALVALVALLALAVRSGWTAAPDRALLLVLAAPPRLAPFVEALTWFADSAVRAGIAAGAGAILLVRHEWRRAIAIVAIVAGGAALNSAVKLLVARPRPDVLPHLDMVTSASFPSGHAANGAILYLALALLVPPRHRDIALGLATALVVAIGLSRVALAVHWPSDVIAGWALGLAWLLVWRSFLAPRAAG